jgi:predicted AlkP superfamily pyrophosphatase or phosphodiesterase
MKRKITKLLAVATLWGLAVPVLALDHVILISVDGLRPDIINQLGKQQLPGFFRFHEEGVWTDNARTDFDYTRTLPNHSSMMTARRVVGPEGHGQITNQMPTAEMTLHNNAEKPAYISSVFDGVHDHGLSTGLYASKDKFVLFEQSYNKSNGATDQIGADNGTDKIDRYVFISPDRTAGALIDRFVADMTADPLTFAFVHIVDTDASGHGDKWTTVGYQDAVKRVDSYLQKIFALVEQQPALKGQTAIVLVADHGGTGRAHSDEANSLNYTIPFYVWAPNVTKGDLYALNDDVRQDPGVGRLDYDAALQPIRNGDAANLALDLLGLPAIPAAGAIINSQQDLKISR